MKILVLDDEPWQLSWISDLAASRGGTCRFASTLPEAKRFYTEDRPDIATVDIRIGESSESRGGATLENADPSWIGLQFLRFVRAESRDSKTKLFVYTGLDREHIQRIVEESYGARFFTKFESREFWDALTKAMR